MKTNRHFNLIYADDNDVTNEIYSYFILVKLLYCLLVHFRLQRPRVEINITTLGSLPNYIA